MTAPAGLRLLIDDAGEGTGKLVVPAAGATPEAVAAIVRHGSGFLFVTLTAAAASRLDLPAMRGTDGPTGADEQSLRQRVSVDAAAGIGTGISAVDRARTASLLADPTTVAADLKRPGHVVPVVVDTGRRSVPADRIHAAVGGSAVFADVPGGAGGTGLAGAAELTDLAAALGIPVVTTRPKAEEPDEFLAQLRADLVVVR